MSNISHNIQDVGDKLNVLSSVIVPIGLLKYISQDQIYRDKNKFTRLQAFFDLVNRSKMMMEGNDSAAANYAQLCKLWNWSRPGLMAFIAKLDEHHLINYEVVMRNKVITIKPEFFVAFDDSLQSQQLEKTSCLLSQPSSAPSPHNSSGLQKERFTERKIDRNLRK